VTVFLKNLLCRQDLSGDAEQAPAHIARPQINA